MARSSLVTSVLRKLKPHVYSGKEFSTSSSVVGRSLYGQHLANEKAPSLSALSHLTTDHGDRISERPRRENKAEEDDQVIFHRCSSQMPAWPAATSGFKFGAQLWSQRSFHGAGASLLHPALTMHYRSLTAGSKTDDDAPTFPGSSGGAEKVEKSVTEAAETTSSSIMESLRSAGDSIDAALPQIKDFLAAHPLIGDVSIPVLIFTGAWAVMPRVLRWLHGYANKSSGLLSRADEEFRSTHIVPYELSVWKAMEEPARLFATLLTILQIGALVSPSSNLAAEYLPRLWSGGSVLCIVWFLHRWKQRKIASILDYSKITNDDRERYMNLDKLVTFGLIALGGLGVAEGLGVAPSSLLTVGGVGGLAAAFAAREILANMLTGLTLSFSKPFSVGDVIKAGGVEGKVQEVGIIATRLLTPDKSQITVPNAFFTSQAITNRSKIPWRSMIIKVPIKVATLESIPRITLEIREMLYRHPEAFLDEDRPECRVSQVTAEALEVVISCNIKPMSKPAYMMVEQNILVEAARIMVNSGATIAGVGK